MNEAQLGGPDNLSGLRDALQKVERDHREELNFDPSQARSSVLGILPYYLNCRYQLGRALRGYKQLFRVEGGWQAALRAIAAAMGRDERTVYRIVHDFEQAEKLPPLLIDAMLEQKIDPAAAKHAPLVENLLQMPVPQSHHQAEVAVTRAVRDVARMRQTKEKKTKSAANEGLEEFATRIAVQFESRYRSASPRKRNLEMQYVFELAAATVHANIRELGRYDLPSAVPKPPKHLVA